MIKRQMKTECGKLPWNKDCKFLVSQPLLRQWEWLRGFFIGKDGKFYCEVQYWFYNKERLGMDEDSAYYTKKQFKKKYGEKMRELGYNIH